MNGVLLASLLLLSVPIVLAQEEAEAAEAGAADSTGFVILILLAGLGAVVAVGLATLREEQQG